MKIAIHRPQQIGGQITEITTSKGTRIIIDLGHNLPSTDNDYDSKDNPQAIAEITKGCKAVLYTHYHGDHVGLCHHVPSDVPQYIGSVAKQIMVCRYEHMSKAKGTKFAENAKKTLESVERMRTYEADKPLEFGDIKVTPYFVSHSACDVHMFLIEAAGKRILHTGDFRGHGWLSKGLIPTLKKYIKHVDVLIIEGTMLSRSEEKVIAESELCIEAKNLMKEPKYVFVQCSSTDMERLVAFKNAHEAVQKGCPFVCDEYQKEVLDIFSSTKGIYTSAFDFGKPYKYSSKNEKLVKRMKEKGFTMLIRPSEKFRGYLKDILQMIDDPKQTLFIYSMWKGYVTRQDTKNEEYIRLRNLFKDFHAEVKDLHTSGHASAETLSEVCKLLNPTTAIIPIHREKGTDFRKIGIGAELQEKVVTKDCTIDGIEITFQ